MQIISSGLLLQAAAKPVYIHTREWADFQLEDETGLNVVYFTSGFGDGLYPSYWGYDGAGDLACLVTDFEVLPCGDRRRAS